MSGSAQKTRYERLVSAFAASAFALLITLSAQQQAANAATASVAQSGTVMTQYHQMTKLKNCPYKIGDRAYTTLRKACNIRSLIKAQQ